MSLSAFQRTWARSKYWAFVALKPGQLPESGGVDAVISALVTYEKNAGAAKAMVAYAAAAKRWPSNLVLLTGLGNSAFVIGDLTSAASAFREAISAHPDSAVAHNNLANVLLAQGDVLAAKESAEKAMRLADKDQKLQSQIQITLDEINAYSIKK
jgi:tetratricopeptide (TPR) repeat protein